MGHDVATLALDKRLDISQQALCLLAALNIQVEELCRIVLNVADLDRLLRSNDQRTALALILPQMHALDVIAVVARLDSLEQIGVVGIAGSCGGHKLVGLFLIRAVLRDNDDCAIAAARAAANNSAYAKTIFIGFDGNITAAQSILDGGETMTVAQSGYDQGYQAVKTVVAHLNGEKVDSFVDCGTKVIDSTTAEDYMATLKSQMDGKAVAAQ